jgi:hypothetical protein
MNPDTALQDLDAKLKIILPAAYRECYEDVQPVSMGSAGLKFDADGRVAWDEIWGSFCDLAMAGGPPHRGTLLEPATEAEIEADPGGYARVTAEICRGVRMVTDLAVDRSSTPGWVDLFCFTPGMAGWMARAIAMENVSVQMDGSVVRLPAGPGFRLEKEIKNVITSVAKTAHYFVDHMALSQQRAIGKLFAESEASAALLQPDLTVGQTPLGHAEATGLPPGGAEYRGWLGLECSSVRAAIWTMRALAVDGVLARREGTVLYVPIHPALDPGGARVVNAVTAVRRLAVRRGEPAQ